MAQAPQKLALLLHEKWMPNVCHSQAGDSAGKTMSAEACLSRYWLKHLSANQRWVVRAAPAAWIRSSFHETVDSEVAGCNQLIHPEARFFDDTEPLVQRHAMMAETVRRQTGQRRSSCHAIADSEQAGLR